jgi:hypothetical protein
MSENSQIIIHLWTLNLPIDVTPVTLKKKTMFVYRFYYIYIYILKPELFVFLRKDFLI